MSERLSTDKLLEMIESAETFEAATAWHQTQEAPRLNAFLYQLMTARDLQPKDVISKSGIERSYFYHILSGVKTPGRNVLLRLALCMALTREETDRTLKLAGLAPLYAKNRHDATIIYALQKHLTMEETNELLIRSGESPLYRDNRS